MHIPADSEAARRFVTSRSEKREFFEGQRVRNARAFRYLMPAIELIARSEWAKP
jgi:hypothetical protein